MYKMLCSRIVVFLFTAISFSTSGTLFDVSSNTQQQSHREKRVALLRVRIPADTCSSYFAGNYAEGYCDGIVSCFSYAGLITGICPSKLGICCIVRKSCGERVYSRVSYFVNRGFEEATSASGTCSLTVNSYQDDVTQIRLDFIQFELDQPDDSGACTTESLTITGADPAFIIPVICGSNTGQHMYINLLPDTTSIVLTVTLSGLSESTFNIRITQFRGDNTEKAPDGCLQYFTETTGQVRSFNYGGSAMQHLSSQFYDVCIRKPTVTSLVTWTASAFDIAVTPIGDDCTSDYVFIPNGVDSTGDPVAAICSTFPTSVTSSDGYRLQVVLNADEDDEGTGTVGRSGFDINYQVI